ncbi:MAG: bactofilin family protein [Bacteriovoracaceae bacterium]
MQESDFKTYNYNVVGLESEVTGTLKLKGDTVFNGSINGELHLLEGKLVLERGSKITGKIFAQEIEVFGEINGDIFCSGKLSFRSSAKFEGDIQSQSLVIYPGAQINMHVQAQE